MKVLVCGSRRFTNWKFLFQTLTNFHAANRITQVIHGDASGADAIAGKWARFNHVAERKWPADWENLGRAAGPIRNQEMLEGAKPDIVFSFDGGRGTADMVRRAKLASVEVIACFSYEYRVP